MTAEIINLAAARAGWSRTRAAAEAVATSPLVVGLAICCLPVCLAYLIGLSTAEAFLDGWSRGRP